MKNIYSSLLLAAAVCSSAMAGDFTAAPSAINHSQVLPMAKNMLTPGRVAGFAAASARKAVQEDPEPEVINYLDGVYTAAQNFYQGDALKDGNGWYYFNLCTGPVDENGTPTSECWMARILVVGDAPADGTVCLPDGTYTFSYDGNYSSAKGSIYGYSTYFYECVEIEGQLMARKYEASTATLTITISEDQSHITGSFDMTGDCEFEDEEGHTYVGITGQMTGTIDCALQNINTVPEPETYTPFDGDYTFVATGMNGCVYDYGTAYDYTTTFYNCELDAEGFIIGGGDLLNIEMMVGYNDDWFNPASFCGTYEFGDIYESAAYTAGHYIGGIWYDYYGWWVPMGTSLYTVDDNGNYTRVALAAGGTITVSPVGEDLVQYDIDLVSAEGHKIQAQWTGKLVDNSEALGYTGPFLGVEADPTGINTVKAEQAEVIYDLQGRRCNSTVAGQAFVVNGKLQMR